MENYERLFAYRNRAPACKSGSFFAGGAVCRAKFVLYIAFLPFLLQDVILSGATEKGAGLEKRRLSRGGVEVFVVEVGALLQAFYSVFALT